MHFSSKLNTFFKAGSFVFPLSKKATKYRKVLFKVFPDELKSFLSSL